MSSLADDATNAGSQTTLAEYSDEVRTARAAQVLALQIKGKSLAKACKEAGVHPNTFREWIRSGMLDDEMAAVRAERQETVVAQALNLLPGVIKNLGQIATGEKVVRGASPVAAAKVLIELAGIFGLGEQQEDKATQQAETIINVASFPNLQTFDVRSGRPVFREDGSLEIIDGEVEEVA